MFADIYQKPGIRLSIWLRRRFNASHFSIAAYALMPFLVCLLLLIYKSESWLLRLVIAFFFIFGLNSAINVLKVATMHNKPSAVGPVIPAAFSCVLVVANFNFSIMHLPDVFAFLSSLTLTLHFYFLAIPGYKIDHEKRESFVAQTHGA